MLYKGYINGNKALFDDATSVMNPKLNLDTNAPDQFNFSIDTSHMHYDEVVLGAIITVFQDGVGNIFVGKITKISTDINQTKTVEAYSFMDAFNDTFIQSDTLGSNVQSALTKILDAHNARVPSVERISLGTCDKLAEAYSETVANITTMQALKGLVEALGGYMRVRGAVGQLKLDYIVEDFPANTQKSTKGDNLITLDIVDNATDVYQYLYPVGKDGLTLGTNPLLEVNGITNGRTLIKEFDAENYQELYGKAMNFINTEMPTVSRSVSASVIDKNMLDSYVPAFKILDKVNLFSLYPFINEQLPITKMQLDLSDVSKNRITLGKDMITTISKKVR